MIVPLHHLSPAALHCICTRTTVNAHRGCPFHNNLKSVFKADCANFNYRAIGLALAIVSTQQHQSKHDRENALSKEEEQGKNSHSRPIDQKRELSRQRHGPLNLLAKVISALNQHCIWPVVLFSCDLCVSLNMRCLRPLKAKCFTFTSTFLCNSVETHSLYYNYDTDGLTVLFKKTVSLFFQNVLGKQMITLVEPIWK